MATEFVQSGVRVTASDGPYLEDGQLTPAAVAYVGSLVDSLADIREYVADRLMNLYNSNWVDERHPVLDRPTFLSRLADPVIELSDEPGAATVYFEDGDMFAGHSIEVMMDDCTPRHAGLVG